METVGDASDGRRIGILAQDMPCLMQLLGCSYARLDPRSGIKRVYHVIDVNMPCRLACLPRLQRSRDF